ncbi:MAG: hypothetical protein R2828_34230 [Saprospiraceae bacterium]
MTRKILLIAILVQLGCGNPKLYKLEDLPIIKSELSWDSDLLGKLELPRYLLRGNSDSGIYGICKFEFSGKGNPDGFGIYLFEEKEKANKKYALLTIKNDPQELIDKVIYDPNKYMLKNIYAHSSEENPEGVLIELEEIKEEYDSIVENRISRYYINELEVKKSGNIYSGDKRIDDWKTISKFRRTNKYSRDFSYRSEDVELEMSLMDSKSKESYSCLIKIKNPKGCVIFYSNYECILIDDKIEITNQAGEELKFNFASQILEGNIETCGENWVIKYKLS